MQAEVTPDRTNELIKELLNFLFFVESSAEHNSDLHIKAQALLTIVEWEKPELYAEVIAPQE